MRIWAVIMAGLLLLGGPALAQGVAPLGGQFQVNSYTTYAQGSPKVSSVDSEGNFVVVWESQGALNLPAWSDVVQAQRFASRPVMVNSFESGDLSAWSSIVQ